MAACLCISRFENWEAGVFWLVKEAMSSLSSSVAVVSVPVIIVSSIVRGRWDPTAGGSAHEAGEKPLLLQLKTARVTTEEGHLDFVCPSVLEGAAMSGAHCGVRMTAECRRPSAVQTRSGRRRLLCEVLRNAASAASLCAAAALEDATNTSRAALRPGTSAAVKISAGLDCASVSPLGSVLIPGSAIFIFPRTASTQAYCPRVASAVLQVSPCST